MENDENKKSIEFYKDFIDDLVAIRPSVLSKWTLSKNWPVTEGNSEINKGLAELTLEQRQIIAQIIQQSRDGGIHDVLAYISEEMNLHELKLVKNEIEMAKEPFDSEMYFDWVCRSEGDPWPDSEV